MWENDIGVTKIWGLVVSKQANAQSEVQWDLTTFLLIFQKDEYCFYLYFTCLSAEMPTVISIISPCLSLPIYSMCYFNFLFLCQFYALPIVRKIAEPTYISFPNENQWVGLLYIDTAATQLVAVDSEEKQWGAINNLVIRAQSRMVMWGKGTCSKRKGRYEQEKWERNGCDTRSCMIYGG